MAAQPAFIAVQARQSVVSKATDQFPPQVVDYVQRAFQEFNMNKQQLSLAGITEPDFRAKLGAILKQATLSNEMTRREWYSYTLPHEFLMNEHVNAAIHLTQGQPTTNSFNPPNDVPAVPGPSPGSNSKKRKSAETDIPVAEADARPVTPPWKKNKGSVSLAERITGKSKNSEKKKKDTNKVQGGGWFDNSQAALERRRQRFGLLSLEDSPAVSSRNDSPSAGARSGPIVGTCQTLEKQYFRLTAPPDPSTVRPLPVLEQTLKLIKQKWKKESNYSYVCDQLKSMRQDLTVQHVKGSFTVEVYEVHARIALQMKDLGEYNQCQTQLRALYKLNLGGRDSRDEFLAYRILYLVYTCNRTGMNDMLADLTAADKHKPIVKHALQVRAALASGNYHRFFKLYGEVQEMQMVPYLMDMFVERERLAATAAVCKAYKTNIGMNFLVSELAFDVDEDDDGSDENAPARRCYEFICRHNGGQLIARNDQTGEFRINTMQAGTIFENARKGAFSKVDIKGQI